MQPERRSGTCTAGRRRGFAPRRSPNLNGLREGPKAENPGSLGAAPPCSNPHKTAESHYEIEKITKIDEIAKFGVMFTPALAVNGEVKTAGKVPEPDEIRRFLQ